MKSAVVCSLALVSMAVGCVQYAQPTYARVVISAAAPPSSGADANVAVAAPTDIPDVPSVPGQRVDAETIRRALSGYGTWDRDDVYGAIWYPAPGAIATDFVPYGTQGHWVQTDAGWYWQSDLRWGWLTFHYGRWVMVRETWAWVPGRMFAPAWVDWRVGGGYVGWAPLPPAGALYTAPYAFCTYDSLYARDLWARTVYGRGTASIYGMTTAVPTSYGIGGAVYAWGPTPVAVPARPGQSAAPPPVLVPVATAWSGEAGSNPRAGSPAGSSPVATMGRPVGATHPFADAPAGVPTQSAASATTLTVATIDPAGTSAGGSNSGRSGYRSDPMAVAPSHPGPWMNSVPVETVPDHVRPSQPITLSSDPMPTVYVDPNVVGAGRYRTSNTVVLSSTGADAPIVRRASTFETGTMNSTSYAAPSVTYGGGGNAAAYAAPSVASSYVPEPSPVAAPSSTAYAPPAAMPAAYAPSTSYAVPNSFHSVNSMPSYGGYAPAPVAAAVPQYHPSYTPPTPVASSYNAGGGYAAPRVQAPSAPVFQPAAVATPVPMHGPAMGGSFRR